MAEDELETILREMAAEPREMCIAREKSAFDRLAGGVRPIALFGAGALGRMVLAGLRRAGVEPRCFVDNNPNLWGKEVEGLRVFSAAEAAHRFGQDCCFVVTIYNGTKTRRQLRDRGCQYVAPFAALFWKYADVFIPGNGIDLPHNLPPCADEIRAVYGMLADEHSRREVCAQLRWRYWLDDSGMPPTLAARDLYFPSELITPFDREVFVDCGAFDGETIRSFLEHTGGRFGHIFSLEPDPANRSLLEQSTMALGAGVSTRITLLPFLVGNQDGPAQFNADGSVSSHITADGGISVECRKLDSIAWAHLPTYIKMDIEGAEPDALCGASGLLRKHGPALAICLYHRTEHLWQLPRYIHETAPGYEVFIRRYAEDCWELVCYAVPKHRLTGPSTGSAIGDSGCGGELSQ
ncbi:MAG: FkbM family methyltransferase [Candidatus Korobacteraceae bacterium]|jgi:FkbM family methyltransferase